MAKKKKNYYGLTIGQFRKEHGRAKTYLLLLVCAIICCAILYLAYRLDMG